MTVSIQTLYAIHDRMTEMAAVEYEAARKALDGDRRDDSRTSCAAAQATAGCASVVLQFIRDSLDEPQQSGSSESSQQKGGVADTGTTDAAAAAFREWIEGRKVSGGVVALTGPGEKLSYTHTIHAQQIFNAGFWAGRKQ